MRANRLSPLRRLAVGFLVFVLLGGFGSTAQSQVANYGGGLGLGGLSPPQFEPEGLWARVISVTPKWIVLQNASGQQFPVSINAINLFLVRWPTDPVRTDFDAWAEVTGIDLNSNRVLANHVDIYEGPAKGLVRPTSQFLIGYNRVMTPLNPFQMNTFGQFTLLPGEELMPRRRHIVGPVLNRNPLTIAVAGNAGVVVVPGRNGLTMTQVTPGSSSFVDPGDLVWTLPAGANPQTLALEELVIFKNVPIDQFVP